MIPIVDSNRPSHRAPPLDPSFGESTPLLVDAPGVIEMKALVVVGAAAPSVGAGVVGERDRHRPGRS